MLYISLFYAATHNPRQNKTGRRTISTKMYNTISTPDFPGAYN